DEVRGAGVSDRRDLWAGGRAAAVPDGATARGVRKAAAGRGARAGRRPSGALLRLHRLGGGLAGGVPDHRPRPGALPADDVAGDSGKARLWNSGGGALLLRAALGDDDGVWGDRPGVGGALFRGLSED